MIVLAIALCTVFCTDNSALKQRRDACSTTVPAAVDGIGRCTHDSICVSGGLNSHRSIPTCFPLPRCRPKRFSRVLKPYPTLLRLSELKYGIFSKHLSTLSNLWWMHINYLHSTGSQSLLFELKLPYDFLTGDVSAIHLPHEYIHEQRKSKGCC